MATLIRFDNTKVELKAANPSGRFTLAELQKAVGGFIELVPQDAHKGDVYCDEEGKLKEKPYNRDASMKCYPSGVPAGYHLVGDVLFLTMEESIATAKDEDE